MFIKKRHSLFGRRIWYTIGNSKFSIIYLGTKYRVNIYKRGYPTDIHITMRPKYKDESYHR